MSTVTIKQPVFDESREHPGFNCRRARIGRQVGSKKVGASLWDLPSGEAAYPYHWHLAEEELLVVLEGTPSLRTPEGWRELSEGEVVSFRCGEEGAHQVVNRSEEPVRFLAVSNQQPDAIVRGVPVGQRSVTDQLLEQRPASFLAVVVHAVGVRQQPEPVCDCAKLEAEYCVAGFGSGKPQSQGGARRTLSEPSGWIANAARKPASAMKPNTSRPL